jgi:hypothetical protein
MIVPGRLLQVSHFHPSLTFADKAGAHPSEASFGTQMIGNFPLTNALAYYTQYRDCLRFYNEGPWRIGRWIRIQDFSRKY